MNRDFNAVTKAQTGYVSLLESNEQEETFTPSVELQSPNEEGKRQTLSILRILWLEQLQDTRLKQAAVNPLQARFGSRIVFH